jgi:hypothetical protein
LSFCSERVFWDSSDDPGGKGPCGNRRDAQRIRLRRSGKARHRSPLDTEVEVDLTDSIEVILASCMATLREFRAASPEVTYGRANYHLSKM